MGLFSNACENPDCQGRVKHKARFCARCGYTGPKSLMKCPAPGCGKQTGLSNRFCWNCGEDLSPFWPVQQRGALAPRIAGNRWVRAEEEFAVRVYPADLEQKWLARRVTVESGTLGLIEHNGRFDHDVPWGSETLERIVSLRGPSSVVLVNAGDAVLRPSFHGLMDVNGAALDLTVQLVFRVGDIAAFATHFLEGHKRRVTFDMLENRFAAELLDVTRGLVSGYALEDMAGNLAWRDEFEEKLRAALTVTLSRWGLDLVQVNFADFAGDAFETLAKDRGEVYMGNHAADHLAEQLAIRKRMRQLEAQGELDALLEGNTFDLEKMRSNKAYLEEKNALANDLTVRTTLSDNEREQTLEQAAQELWLNRQVRNFEREDLTNERAAQLEARQQELDTLRAEYAHQSAMALLIARNERVSTEGEFQRAQERLDHAHTLEEAWKAGEQRRRDERAHAVQRYELVIEEARTNLEASRHKTQQRMSELEAERAQIDLAHYDEAQKEKLKRENREHQVTMLARIQEQERLNMETMRRFDLEEKRLELDARRFEKEKDTEVQLASIQGNVQMATAQERVDAAAAQAAMQQLMDRLGDQKADKEALRADANQRAQDLKDLAGTLSANKSPVVVLPGGGTVDAGGGTGGGKPEDREFPCPNCNRPVPIRFPNCPHCRHAIAK